MDFPDNCNGLPALSRRRKPRASKLDELDSYRDQIAQWRREGFALRAIVAKLRLAKCKTVCDHCHMARFVTRHRIAKGSAAV